MDTTHDAKLQTIFRVVLQLPEQAEVAAVRQPDVPTWDSLAHTLLIAAIESEFGLQIDAADSLELTSYAAAAQYVEKHTG